MSINSTVSPLSRTNERAVDSVADGLLGKPFIRGARGPEAYDCFGLLLELYRAAGLELPDPMTESPTVAAQLLNLYSCFSKVEGTDLRCLDVIKQQREGRSHVSIYLSGGYALDTREAAFRARVADLRPFVTDVWRHRCLAG